MTLLILGHLRRMQGQAARYLEPTPTYENLQGAECPHIGAGLDHDDPNIDASKNEFVGDMIYMLDGPEQREAQAELEFDYVAETDVTASGMDGRSNISVTEFRRALVKVVEAAEEMDKMKKVLFRGRSRSEAGLGATVDLNGMLDSKIDLKDIDLLHGIVGVITESGEMAEVLLNKLVYDQAFDEVNVKEEIGDQLWYLSRLIKWAGTTFLAEMMRNIRKLRGRHGKDGFSKTGDVNRNLEAERASLTDTPVIARPQTQFEGFPDEPGQPKSL